MSVAEQLPLVTSVNETLADWEKLETKQKMGAIAALTITASRPILRALHEAQRGNGGTINASDIVKDLCLDASDKADGMLARSTGAVTPLGKELDPLMDKVDFAIQEVAQYRRGQLPLGHIAVRLARDIVVTLVRAHVNAATDGNVNIGAGWHGKASTGIRLASSHLSRLPAEYISPKFQKAQQTLATGAILASGAKNVIDLMKAKNAYLSQESLAD